MLLGVAWRQRKNKKEIMNDQPNAILLGVFRYNKKALNNHLKLSKYDITHSTEYWCIKRIRSSPLHVHPRWEESTHLPSTWIVFVINREDVKPPCENDTLPKYLNRSPKKYRDRLSIMPHQLLKSHTMFAICNNQSWLTKNTFYHQRNSMWQLRFP